MSSIEFLRRYAALQSCARIERWGVDADVKELSDIPVFDRLSTQNYPPAVSLPAFIRKL
jgi:hypothetical protein